jgi:hypothetical protein
MTREDIIRMADEAGFFVQTAEQLREKTADVFFGLSGDPVYNELERFAALVAAAEREACAKIADSQIKNTAILTVYPGKSAAAWDIANAIRARGSK